MSPKLPKGGNIIYERSVFPLKVEDQRCSLH